jgi:ATP-dependent Clp protease ATP-binding subunit ClpC
MTLPERRQNPPDIKLTESAKGMLKKAQAEAVSRNHGFVGSEHLLLAIMSDPDSVAHKLIAPNLNDNVREDLEHSLPYGRGVLAADTKPELTPNARVILISAIREAREENATPVDTQHILFGIMQSNTVASGLLEYIGIGVRNLPELRKRAMIIQQRNPQKPS